MSEIDPHHEARGIRRRAKEFKALIEQDRTSIMSGEAPARETALQYMKTCETLIEMVVELSDQLEDTVEILTAARDALRKL